MPKPDSVTKKPRRSHSFGGCGTCRRRHVKCDQVRPTCLSCRAVGAVCMGYRSDLKWIKSSDIGRNDVNFTEPTAQSVRNHLYSEKSRASMSTALLTDLATKPVDETISELDARCKDASPNTGETIAIGPFGVFSFPAQPAFPYESIFHEQTHSGIENTELVNEAPQTVESVNSQYEVNDWLDWPDLFDLEFDYTDLVPANLDDPFGDAQFPVLQPSNEQAGSYQSISVENPDQSMADRGISVHHADSVSVEPSPMNARPRNLKPADAELLLKHFQDHVLHQMVSLPVGEKSSWEITSVNSAMLTLARVTYMTSQPVSSAALANLLAICAIAANHLSMQNTIHNEESRDCWQDFAARTFKEAKQEIQRSLRDEIKGPKTAKYKDQLMAVSAILGFAILYDCQQDARTYMIDAERLLRLRGLAKRHISRKARILHHMYTWARILGESTYVLRNYSNADFEISTQARNNTAKHRRAEFDEEATQEHRHGPNPRLDDFLRSDPSLTKDGKDMMDQKDKEAGLHDIHLEDLREWPETLYLQLYGVPEIWLSLVSQTTRLANLLDSLNAGKTNKADVWVSVERRKSRLENAICTFDASNDPSDSSGSHEETQYITSNVTDIGSAEARSCMLRALNSALVIYFYRRIKNVNPWILQEHVNKVIKALKDFDSSCKRHKIEGPGSPWPGFMAGCEAMSKTQRDYFSSWFNKAIHLTGFKRLETAKASMLEVWKRRDSVSHGKHKKSTRATDTVCTWIQICRERNEYLLLS